MPELAVFVQPESWRAEFERQATPDTIARRVRDCARTPVARVM